MKKSAIYLSLTVFIVFLFSASAFADTVTGFGGWQGFGVTSESGPQFWANSSWDGEQKNIGYYLTNSGGGAGAISDFPGPIPYYGIAVGSADTNFYFHKTSSGSNVVLKVEVAGYNNVNEFGYYLLSAPGTLISLLTGPESPPATNSFQPTGDYGFYLKSGSGDTWKTGGTGEHFAVFQQSSTPMAEIYWIGMEDLPFSNTDKDYNDMIVKVSQVPVPEPTTMLLLGSGLIGLAGYGRKKFFKK